MSGIVSALYFLLNLAFSLVLFVLWARIFLRYFRVSALHPISRLIDTLTTPVVGPVASLIGQNKPRQSLYDLPCFLVVILVELFKYIIIGFLLFNRLLPLEYLLLFVMADLITQPCNLMFYAIIIRVVMSWVNPMSNHPAQEALYLITEPLLRQGRKIIPTVSGFDLSPIIILAGLTVITILASSISPRPF
tara:strand:- start:155 stop:727 length:573 start_codon:yes stop_codon:yes gene_type:complete